METSRADSQMTPSEWRIRLGKVRAAMAERRDPKSVRDWILWAAFETDSLIAQYYRAFGEDLDSDMAAASYAFVEDGDLEKDEGSYYLRRLWRVLLRKYAFRDAWVLDKTLCPLENGLWRCWRRKDLLLWRLAMGLFAGHVILWSSSGLLAFLDLVQWRLHWVVAVGAFSLFVVFALAVVDVQHRVGRRGWPVIFGRAALIMGIGVFYATVFGIAIYVLASRLAQCYGPHLLKSLLVASMALVLGFVFHLFWQEGSLGDPL